MHVSRVLLLVVAAVVVATTEAVDTPCTAAKYADTYASVQTQIAACETASGVSPLELPLANKKKLALCDACPELAALANAKTLPTCTITQSNGDSYTLRQQIKKLFNKCTGDSDSGSDAASKESVATSTPTPTATTKTPSTTTKSSSSTSTSTTPNVNSKSSATASSVAGDADDGATPTTSAISKAATFTPTSSSTNANGASGSKNDASQQTSGNDKGTLSRHDAIGPLRHTLENSPSLKLTLASVALNHLSP